MLLVGLARALGRFDVAGAELAGAGAALDVAVPFDVAAVDFDLDFDFDFVVGTTGP